MTETSGKDRKQLAHRTERASAGTATEGTTDGHSKRPSRLLHHNEGLGRPAYGGKGVSD